MGRTKKFLTRPVVSYGGWRVFDTTQIRSTPFWLAVVQRIYRGFMRSVIIIGMLVLFVATVGVVISLVRTYPMTSTIIVGVVAVLVACYLGGGEIKEMDEYDDDDDW